MPKGNYLKRLQAVRKQFVWLKATQLDAVNGVSVTIIWTLVAYYVSVATNQCAMLDARETWNSAPILSPTVCGGMCCLTANKQRLFLQILIIPHPLPDCHWC
jgi:hypothetical protein